MPYALLSEYNRLSADQKAACTHIIPDDGEWTKEQIAEYVNAFIGYPTDTKEQEETGR